MGYGVSWISYYNSKWVGWIRWAELIYFLNPWLDNIRLYYVSHKVKLNPRGGVVGR